MWHCPNSAKSTEAALSIEEGPWDTIALELMAVKFAVLGSGGCAWPRCSQIAENPQKSNQPSSVWFYC